MSYSSVQSCSIDDACLIVLRWSCLVTCAVRLVSPRRGGRVRMAMQCDCAEYSLGDRVYTGTATDGSKRWCWQDICGAAGCSSLVQCRARFSALIGVVSFSEQSPSSWVLVNYSFSTDHLGSKLASFYSVLECSVCFTIG